MKETLKPKIKVLHVVPSLEAGGIENLLFNLYEFFDKDKFDFSLITHKDGGLIFEKFLAVHAKIYVVSPKRASIFRHVKDYLRIINNTKFDIIHIHQGELSLTSLFLAWIVDIKIRIVHTHSFKPCDSLFNKVKLKIKSFLITLLGTNYIACSNEAALNLFGKNFSSSNKLWVMKNSVNLEKFHYEEQADVYFRKKFAISEKYVIGMIARFSIEKNHIFSLSIFEKIADVSKDFCFVYIGDGILFDSFVNQVKSSRISKKVKFLGGRDDVSSLIPVFDVILIPSFHEGLGIVAIEAQACGIKIFVADNLSKDINLTDLIEYLPLNAGPDFWCRKIISSLPYKKYTRTNEIRLAGFDIRDTANLLMKYYSKNLETNISCRQYNP